MLIKVIKTIKKFKILRYKTSEKGKIRLVAYRRRYNTPLCFDFGCAIPVHLFGRSNVRDRFCTDAIDVVLRPNNLRHTRPTASLLCISISYVRDLF